MPCRARCAFGSPVATEGAPAVDAPGRRWPARAPGSSRAVADDYCLEDAALQEAAQELALASSRDAGRCSMFFGSRRTGAAQANAWSAYDVFVVVHRYRPFYRGHVSTPG